MNLMRVTFAAAIAVLWLDLSPMQNAHAETNQALCCFANPPCCQSQPGGNTCKPVHVCGVSVGGDPLGTGRPARGPRQDTATDQTPRLPNQQ
jgi:hypothetical protein